MSSAPPKISNPLRIICISPPGTETIELLKGATFEIHTPYYNASIPVWHDNIDVSTDAVKAWEEEWRADEAGEVVRSIGAWVVTIRKPRKSEDQDSVRTLLTTLSSVIAQHAADAVNSYSLSNEPLLFCLGTYESTTPRLEMLNDEWEDLCQDCGGWEWIDGEETGSAKNEFGEVVGVTRLKEALEAHEWDNTMEEAALSDDLGFEIQDEGFQATVDMEDQTPAVKEPILQGESSRTKEVSKGKGQDQKLRSSSGSATDDDQVLELEAMMLRLKAVKDMGTDMPESERRRIAARAVNDVLKKL